MSIGLDRLMASQTRGTAYSLAKALAADDADALSAEDSNRPERPVICPNCGKTGTPAQIKRHYRATGHGEREEPERVPAEAVAGASQTGYDAPMTKAVEDSHIIAMTPELRHTVVAVTPDEFGADPEAFQEHLFDLTKDEGVKLLRADDGTKLGHLREFSQWPFGSAPEVLAKDGAGLRRVELPPGTVYLGVEWEPQAWAEFQAGEFSPTASVRDALTS